MNKTTCGNVLAALGGLAGYAAIVLMLASLYIIGQLAVVALLRAVLGWWL